MKDDIYRPHTATVLDVTREAGGGRPIHTFKVRIDDEECREDFLHRPGQFLLASAFGVGESVFAVNSAPNTDGILSFSVMRVGNVTTRLHELKAGDKMGVRGPYGNHFPVGDWKGKDLIFIGAGIGISPVASVYRYVLSPEIRDDYGDVTIIYGARTPADLSFKGEFEELEARDDLDVWLCIDWKFGPDGPVEESAAEGWPAINMGSPEDTEVPAGKRKFTAFVPQLVEVVRPEPENSVAVTCGPPIAIKFITQALDGLGWGSDQIYTTLENRMKCGIGKCGRCNIGGVYICKDGPVFTYDEIRNMRQEF